MTLQRLWLLWIIGGLLAGATLLATVSPALGQEGPSITIDPSSGPCGIDIEVTGTGFEANVGVFLFAVSASHIFGFELAEPNVTTDAGGEFRTEIAMPTFAGSCPAAQGMIVFACPQPLCEPKLRVPYEVTQDATGFPSTGGGAASPDMSPPATGLAGAGIAAIALGLTGLVAGRAKARRRADR